MNRKKIEDKIEKLKQLDIFNRDSFYYEMLNNIIESSKKKPFKIVIVGEFSTGKSTFINAILGCDLLTHATEEVTATITNIHNISDEDKRYKTCDVILYDDTKIHFDNDIDFVQYTTTKSKDRNVVKDIKCVDYYTNFMEKDTDIVIVDTPGLNGMADGHRELTLEEIKSADYCIYLFGIRGIADSDKVILNQLSYYQNKYIFILNFIDQLKVSEGENVQERIDEISKLIDNEIFKDDSKKEYAIFGVSALKALAAKDNNIKKLYYEDISEISDAYRDKLYEESGFKEFEDYIKKQINNKTIEKIYVDRMKYLIENLLDSISEELEESQKETEYLRKETSSEVGISRLEEKLKYFIDVSAKNKEKVITYAESECINIKKEFMEYLNNELEKIKLLYSEKLQCFSLYDDLENYVKNGELDTHLKTDADKIYNYIEANLANCFNGILSNILIRIKEYICSIKMDNKNTRIKFDIKKISSKQEAQIITLESGLSKVEKSRYEAEQRYDSILKEIENDQNKYKEYKKALSKNEQALLEQEREQKRQLDNLGIQPEVEEHYEYTTEYYTTYEERGGLGIMDALFGPKKVQKTRQIKHTIIDDSKRRKWVEDSNRIRQNTQYVIDQYRASVDSDKNLIRKIEMVLKKKKGDIEIAKEDYEYYNKKLEQDKNTLDNLRKKANRELLNALRKNINEQIEAYCDYQNGEIAKIVKQYIKESVDKNKKLILKRAAQFYDERFNAMCSMYRNEIEGGKQNVLLKYDDYSDQLEKIQKIREEIKNDI